LKFPLRASVNGPTARLKSNAGTRSRVTGRLVMKLPCATVKLAFTATAASDFLTAGFTTGPLAVAVKVAGPDCVSVTLLGAKVIPASTGGVTVTAPVKPAAKGTLMTICTGCPRATATGVTGP